MVEGTPSRLYPSNWNIPLWLNRLLIAQNVLIKFPVMGYGGIFFALIFITSLLLDFGTLGMCRVAGRGGIAVDLKTYMDYFPWRCLSAFPHSPIDCEVPEGWVWFFPLQSGGFLLPFPLLSGSQDGYGIGGVSEMVASPSWWDQQGKDVLESLWVWMGMRVWDFLWVNVKGRIDGGE